MHHYGHLDWRKEKREMPALTLEVRDQIAYLTLNRPHVHNSLNPEMIVQLAEAWERVKADDSIRVAIVTGAGDKAFSAGADLGRLIPLTTKARPPEDEWDHKLLANPQLREMALLREFELWKPVIAVVNGFCIAGGMELMLATDLRIAADHASFGLQEVKWALIPAGGSMVRLPRQIPYCQAMEILLTGNRIGAHEAHRIGLVNHVLPAGQIMAKAEELATAIAANGPLAVRAIKEAAIKSSGGSIDEGFALENRLAKVVFSANDAEEGPRAFMEKRKPVFKGN
jgi:enoyl-CoA hydratase